MRTEGRGRFSLWWGLALHTHEATQDKSGHLRGLGVYGQVGMEGLDSVSRPHLPEETLQGLTKGRRLSPSFRKLGELTNYPKHSNSLK